MSELMPEPALPIFGEEVVSVQRMLDSKEQWERRQASETVLIRVDEIDDIEDPRYRQALWGKYRDQTDPGAKKVRFITVNPDGSYHGTVSVRKGSLMMNNQAAEEEITEVAPNPVSEPDNRGFFSRLLGQ